MYFDASLLYYGQVRIKVHFTKLQLAANWKRNGKVFPSHEFKKKKPAKENWKSSVCIKSWQAWLYSPGNRNIGNVCSLPPRQLGWVTDTWDSSIAAGYAPASKQTASPAGAAFPNEVNLIKSKQFVQKHLRCRQADVWMLLPTSAHAKWT